MIFLLLLFIISIFDEMGIFNFMIYTVTSLNFVEFNFWFC